MNNKVYEDAWVLPVVVTDPAVPQGGDPCRWGFLTGVAVDDENAAGVTVVDFGQRVYTLTVTDRVGGGIAVGDTLFYADATNDLDNVTTGTPFGYACEIVGAGLAAAISVLHVPGHGAATLGAGVVAAANLAANAVETAKILNAAVTAAKIADNVITGAKVGNVANANTTGGIEVLHRIDVADAATGDIDVVLDHKERVVDAWCVKTAGAGGAANTIQVKNGANAITDAMSININDQAIARAGSVDDAQHEIAAGGTLRITRTKAGGNAACICYVRALRVA